VKTAPSCSPKKTFSKAVFVLQAVTDCLVGWLVNWCRGK
jgi:hypothetical protein